MGDTLYGVLAGFDGSPGSEEALIWAVQEARARGEKLTLCHVWGPPAPTRLSEVSEATQAAEQAGQWTLACGTLLAQTLMGGKDIHPVLAAGPAAAALCGRSARADLLVVGSRGHSGLAGLLLGSVSAQAAGHASAPVVVMRGHWRPVSGSAPLVVVGACDQVTQPQGAGSEISIPS
jgi:nucleotide-binding universal stress UspA family protein